MYLFHVHFCKCIGHLSPEFQNTTHAKHIVPNWIVLKIVYKVYEREASLKSAYGFPQKLKALV